MSWHVKPAGNWNQQSAGRTKAETFPHHFIVCLLNVSSALLGTSRHTGLKWSLCFFFCFISSGANILSHWLGYFGIVARHNCLLLFWQSFLRSLLRTLYRALENTELLENILHSMFLMCLCLQVVCVSAAGKEPFGSVGCYSNYFSWELK